MNIITTEELEGMEVVNLCDGARLGCPSGVEIDLSCGNVTALLVPKERGWLPFGKGDVYRIPWCRIQCVGEDAILVKIEGNDLSSCLCGRGRRKR